MLNSLFVDLNLSIRKNVREFSWKTENLFLELVKLVVQR